jgi:hypothetical protein
MPDAPQPSEQRPFFAVFLGTRVVSLGALLLMNVLLPRLEVVTSHLSVEPDVVWVTIKIVSNLVLIVLALLRQPLLVMMGSFYMVWGLVEHAPAALARVGEVAFYPHLLAWTWALGWLLYFSLSGPGRAAWSELVKDARRMPRRD